MPPRGPSPARRAASPATTAATSGATVVIRYDASGIVYALLSSTFVPSLSRAVCAGGGLEKLGLNGLTQISTASRKTLTKWKVSLTMVAGIFMLIGFVCIVSVTRVGQPGVITGRVVTAIYAYTTVLPFGLMMCFINGLILLLWMFALQHGSILVSEKVTKVTETMKYLKPSDPEWQTLVVEGVRMLVNVTLPDLSDAFGNTLGNLTIALWAVGLGFFAAYLQARRIFALICVFFCAFIPFGIAATVSDTSDRCDKLRGAINQKRIADLGLHFELSALETCMDNENRGQGLGCAIV
eukprot:SAG11_NODE_702_length_7661_cov_3.468659_8_plen_296_part_00